MAKKPKPEDQKYYNFSVSAPRSMDVSEQAARAGFTGNRSAYIVHLLRQDARRLAAQSNEVTK